MVLARSNWFVQVDVAVSDFDVETAGRIRANPGFIMHRCSLTTIVRERHQLACIALETLRYDSPLHSSTSHRHLFVLCLLLLEWHLMLKNQEIEEKRIKIDDIEVNYKIAGEGPTILILHGWGRGSDSWITVQVRLAQQGYTVVVPDLPGFGKSEPPQTVWGVKEYVEFLKGFADVLGVKKFSLIGGSFGGQSAAHFSVSYPEYVERLVLSAPAIVRRQPGLGRRMFMYVSHFFDGVFSLWFLRGIHPLARKIVYKLLGSTDYLYTKGIMKEVGARVRGQDLSYLLPRIVCPTLILWGDKDTLTPFKDASIVKAGIANASLRAFPNVGHSIHRETPEEFIKAVAQFLAPT